MEGNEVIKTLDQDAMTAVSDENAAELLAKHRGHFPSKTQTSTRVTHERIFIYSSGVQHLPSHDLLEK